MCVSDRTSLLNFDFFDTRAQNETCAPRVNLPHFAAFHYYRTESNIPYTHIHVGEIERGGGFKYHSYLP